VTTATAGHLAARTARADVVVLEDVTRRYDVGGTTVTALGGVDLRVGAGELVVVLGPSGCGKTTLLNMIGALDVPTSGRVVIAGQDLAGANRRDLAAYRRATVGFVFQTFNLFPTLTAIENVQFGIDVAHRRGAEPDLAREVLERVGLGDRTEHFPGQLSGGEQQRTAIARALATGAPLLLADEPTGELDFRTGVQIIGLLQEQAQRGTCVIVVTHNREIARAADRVVELSSGLVVGDAPPTGGRVALDDLRW
jgi:putative ABC transport system ATP-binding protein